MARYLITHSLLSSWLYSMKENPYEDASNAKNPLEDFMRVLRREPTETTEAMQRGIDFEDLVTDIVNGRGDESNRWYAAASRVACIVRGGVLQFKASKAIHVHGLDFVLYGRLDCLKAGEIFDIKFSSGYDRGKYVTSTQHPVYLEIVPEARAFTYLVSNGTEVWTERYLREDTPDVHQLIYDFVDWLSAQGLLELYEETWSAR